MTASVLVRVEPHWRVIVSRYGDALIERRELRGFDSASDLAKKSKEVAEQLNDPQLSAFSQQTLSRLESDKTGEYIANARPRIQRMLSYLLGWSAEEFEAAVGISIPAVSYLGSVPTESTLETYTPRRGGPPIPPVVSFRETPISIPNELLEMVEKYGDTYPILKTERMQRMLAAPRAHGGLEVGPQTADDWFEYWIANKRFLT
ncbi:hypothetical protein [Deinococcus sp. QL22]|uniref:hypothetical protein n=1 Tax=Deinococcus sp. QL22 TaxID=2939437 RepID=UPI00201755A1|nr:hypothetical protein [Deinococcus sp. QL22]UQN05506.1 hypothetical protein M1R55_11530 [Deinococcus sp. QL22]